eukprot:344787-Rhodomonas_salina.1
MATMTSRCLVLRGSSRTAITALAASPKFSRRNRRGESRKYVCVCVLLRSPAHLSSWDGGNEKR